MDKKLKFVCFFLSKEEKKEIFFLRKMFVIFRNGSSIGHILKMNKNKQQWANSKTIFAFFLLQSIITIFKKSFLISSDSVFCHFIVSK